MHSNIRERGRRFRQQESDLCNSNKARCWVSRWQNNADEARQKLKHQLKFHIHDEEADVIWLGDNKTDSTPALQLVGISKATTCSNTLMTLTKTELLKTLAG